MRYAALYRKPNGCEGAVTFDVPDFADTVIPLDRARTIAMAAEAAAGKDAVVLRIDELND